MTTPAESYPILQYFRFDHLPEHLQEVSRPFTEIADRRPGREAMSVTNAEYQATMQQLLTLSPLIADIDLSGFLERIERAEVMGVFAMPPILYSKALPNLDHLKRLAHAFLGVQSVVLKAREEEARKRGLTVEELHAEIAGVGVRKALEQAMPVVREAITDNLRERTAP